MNTVLSYSKSVKEVKTRTNRRSSRRARKRSSMLSATALNITILLIICCNRNCSRDALARPRRDGAPTVPLARGENYGNIRRLNPGKSPLSLSLLWTVAWPALR